MSRQGKPQALAWPSRGWGCTTDTGREAGTRGSDRGGWGGGRAAKQEEQTSAIQTLLARTALAVMTHSEPGGVALDTGVRKPRVAILTLLLCDLGQVTAPLEPQWLPWNNLLFKNSGVRGTGSNPSSSCSWVALGPL